MKKVVLRTLIVFAFILFICSVKSNATSLEKIYDYRSDIYINKDSSIIVEETIRVYADGDNIKRGIYREFPTKYKDKYGNNYKVKFEVLQILKDEVKEPYHIEKKSNGVKIYIGDSNTYLKKGYYTYTIKYKTTRQIGYFEDFDSIYWNATGNGWDFVIDRASAVVHLPDGADMSKVKFEAYTGPQGSDAKDYQAYKNEIDNTVTFYTTEKLNKKEGLTITVSFEKGLVHEPTFQEKLQYFFEDNVGVLVGLIGAIIIIIYGFITWKKVGKDPKKDIIIPRYNPPEGLTPGDVKYIDSMGGYSKVFEATILNLAVKGYLKIDTEKKKFGGSKITLIKTEKEYQNDLSDDEREVIQGLPYTAVLEYSSSLQSKLSRLQTSQQKKLNDRMNKKMYSRNGGFIAIAILLTIIDVAIAVIAAGVGFESLFIGFWLGIWTSGTVVMLKNTKKKIVNILFALPFLLGEIVGMWFLIQMAGTGIALLITVLAIIDTIYVLLIKAYTEEGRKLKDEIEGFKLFIKTASEDEIKEQTPETFEKYFPYAYVLGLENKWAEKFESVLAQANYEPTWCTGVYVGPSFNSTLFTSTFTTSLSSSISSASTAPGSSSGFSGGGGGFSGGGGGGRRRRRLVK